MRRWRSRKVCVRRSPRLLEAAAAKAAVASGRPQMAFEESTGNADAARAVPLEAAAVEATASVRPQMALEERWVVEAAQGGGGEG